MTGIELPLQEYHQNGFAVIKGFFSAEEMRRVRAHVQRCLHEMISAAEPEDVYYEGVRTRSVRYAFRMHERSAVTVQGVSETGSSATCR